MKKIYRVLGYPFDGDLILDIDEEGEDDDCPIMDFYSRARRIRKPNATCI